MLAEITLGIQGIQAATGLVRALSVTSTSAQINEVKIGLQHGLLDAQAALFAAQAAQMADAARINSLEQEILHLKDWDAEKHRYELRPIDTSAFAYVHKPGMESGEAALWLCQTCFEKGQKSVLQFNGQVISPPGRRGTQAGWRCNACQAVVWVSEQRRPNVLWLDKTPEPLPAPPVPMKVDYDPFDPSRS